MNCPYMYIEMNSTVRPPLSGPGVASLESFNRNAHWDARDQAFRNEEFEHDVISLTHPKLKV